MEKEEVGMEWCVEKRSNGKVQYRAVGQGREEKGSKEDYLKRDAKSSQ